MDLTREEGVLGDIGLARVLVQGEEEEPDDADDDAEEGEDGRDADEEEAGVVPQVADCRCLFLVSV